MGNYWINVATLTGSNSPAVLHYEGAPEPNADPKLGAPKLDLGCRYQLQSAGIIDFKDTTLRPYRGLPKPPAGKATSAHVVYLTDSAVPSMSQESVLGPRSIYGLQKTVRSMTSCLPPGRWLLCSVMLMLTLPCAAAGMRVLERPCPMTAHALPIPTPCCHADLTCPPALPRCRCAPLRAAPRSAAPTRPASTAGA